MTRFFLTLLLSSLTTLLLGTAWGQTPAENPEAAYQRVVRERADKIVGKLTLPNAQVADRVAETIARQYQHLNSLHEGRKTALAALTDPAQKQAVEDETARKLAALHQDYLTQLATSLSPEQVDQVKDGMTYGVLPITYKGYQAMLPTLTDAQKTQILAWLTEARERAMDEGTSEKKHAMFGKYKGRINNYLSAAGIDMKKASKEWEARIAEEAKNTKK